MNDNNVLNTFPILVTERLILIQITQKHIENIFDIFSNDKVTEHYDCFSYTNRSQAELCVNNHEKRFREKAGIRWGITLKGNDQVIGTIGYNNFQAEGNGTIGYDLNEKFWGRGIISEAIKAIVDFGFETLKIHRIEANVGPDNKASQKVLEKNGFLKEGLMRDKGFWKNQFQTFLVYSILSTDR
jgi:ribosomal-protein-alanine N-acetyltransferase